MLNAGWIRASKISDIADGRAVTLEIEGRAVAVFRSGNDFYAIDNVCPHKGAPLADGSLENCQVTCSWHAWTFDIKTGDCETVPGVRIKTYRVKVEKGDVFVHG